MLAATTSQTVQGSTFRKQKRRSLYIGLTSLGYTALKKFRSSKRKHKEPTRDISMHDWSEYTSSCMSNLFPPLDSEMEIRLMKRSRLGRKDFRVWTYMDAFEEEPLTLVSTIQTSHQ